MNDLLFPLGGAAVALVIVCLIVREQTESRVRALRVELMSLRTKEKRISEKRDEIEMMESEIREAILRTSRREHELEQATTRYRKKLGEIHLVIRQEAMPEKELESETVA